MQQRSNGRVDLLSDAMRNVFTEAVQEQGAVEDLASFFVAGDDWQAPEDVAARNRLISDSNLKVSHARGTESALSNRGQGGHQTHSG